MSNFNEFPDKSVLHVLVCGGRHFNDYSIFSNIMDSILSDTNYDRYEIVSGHAQGTDSMAEKYAQDNGLELKIFPAEWSVFGKTAGPIRNQRMIDYLKGFKHSFVIGFTSENTKGTNNTLNLANKAGIPFIEIPYELKETPFDLNEGIIYNGSNYELDWDNNTDEDLVKFSTTCVSYTKFDKKIRFFGYKINKNSDKSDRNRFLKDIKYKENLLQFELINRSIEDFYENSGITHFDYVIKMPSKSNINDVICKTILDNYDNPKIISPKKKPVSELSFNWDKFLSTFNGNENYLNKFREYIDGLIKSLKKNNEFSINSVPVRYRKYINNMIDFGQDKVTIAENSNVLIVDDIFTTGSSVLMVLNALENTNSNIFIYTLISNR